jgi:hypothetical protein
MLDCLPSFQVQVGAATLGQLKYLVGIFHADCTGQGVWASSSRNWQYQSFVSMKLMFEPGARYDAVWGKLFQSPSDFVALVYLGV